MDLYSRKPHAEPSDRILAFTLSFLALFVFSQSAKTEEVFRKWTDTDGREIQAALTAFDGARVILKGDGGRQREIAFESLSTADQRFCKQWKEITDRMARITDTNVAVEVEFGELTAEFQPLKEVFRTHLELAVMDWASRFETRPCTITVAFDIRDSNRGGGSSLANAPTGEKYEGKTLYEQGAAHEIRTGKDPNGDKADIRVFLDPAFTRGLWFDPEIEKGVQRIPRLKVDGYTVILHEVGHAFGFNGWRDWTTGQLGGNHLSVYDRWVKKKGDDFYFHGPKAMAMYGSPIELAKTNNNLYHVAEINKTTDRLLQDDLMNGIRFKFGRRYPISPLCLAMLADCGLPLKSRKDRDEIAKLGPLIDAIVGDYTQKVRGKPEPKQRVTLKADSSAFYQGPRVTRLGTWKVRDRRLIIRWETGFHYTLSLPEEEGSDRLVGQMEHVKDLSTGISKLELIRVPDPE